jgi:hypothetical protein
MRWVLLASVLVVGVAACGSKSDGVALNHPEATPIPESPGTVKPPSAKEAAKADAKAEANAKDCDAVPVFAAGEVTGEVCRADAAARGLTVVDLGDDWTPAVLTRAPDGAISSYHDRYVAIANEKLGKDAEPEDKLGELYGVTPALAVVQARLRDQDRHRCWQANDPAPIGALTRALSRSDQRKLRAAVSRRESLSRKLDQARSKRGLVDNVALAAVPGFADKVAAYNALTDQLAGLIAAQRRLACEGHARAEKREGDFTSRTGDAVELFQRRNFLMPNAKLDAETRAALQLDSRELDFRLALRILRERIADAAALIEDGSAGDGPVPVLGRMLDPADMRTARGHEPLAHAAPDLIHPATEAAARALGWTDPAGLAAFLDRHERGAVAIALPPRPAYHAAHMELRAELDRGDVWYDERPRRRKVANRPTLILYAKDGDVDRPLVRWPTTIGGWAEEAEPGKRGEVVQKWKESDVGPRIWKDLYGAPTWAPPKTTPDRDLVHKEDGEYRLKKRIFGPGAHSAYGLVMLVHHRPVDGKDKDKKKDDGFRDNGIRTHGSSSVTSIVNGTSHGCHRLYNQLAVRLSGFLLRHRDHVVKGEQPLDYERTVAYKGVFEVDVKNRGFLYELTPPVPVEVTPGTIKSRRKTPPAGTAPARP